MVYVFLANGFEEVEALAPIDLLRRAAIPTTVVGVGSEYIRGSHGIVVKADITDVCFAPTDIDAVILPGGMPGASNLDACEAVDIALKAAVDGGKIVGAICAAPFVLGKRGYLCGKRATCFPGFEAELLGAGVSGARVERDGNIITAIGMGAAMEFGLMLVAAIKDEETASQLSKATLSPVIFGD